ncbi:GspE/PulE/PilB domain-containing protein [Anaeromyxobacter paludicola]|nr:hypothetical protein [Anaeromyxobacter paludicola]
MLIEAGVIDDTQLKAALGHQRRWGGKLGQSLVDMKMTTEAHIVEALARRFGYEVVNLRDLRPSPALDAALALVSRDLATRHTFLPFAVDTGSLSIAMSDPSNIAAVDELSFRTGKRIKVALAGDREVYDAIRRFYYAEEEAERTVEPITLETDPEPAPLQMETTTDPFGSLQSFFDEMARQPPAAAPAPRPPAPPARAPAPPAPAPRAVTPPAAFARPAPAPAPVRAAPPPPARLAPPPAGVGARPPLDLFDEDEILDVSELAPAEPPAGRPLAPGEQLLVEAVLKLARGEPVDPAILSPQRLAAGLIRLLLDKKVVTPAEVAQALSRR